MKDVELKLKFKMYFVCLMKNEINVICRGLKLVLLMIFINKKVFWKFLEFFQDLMILVKNNINVNLNKIMLNF